ncbi:hypothetical protein A2U01_0104578, partial [Trifolium medium]|nr:hypothetical protein [Trifolium medium]
AEIWERRCLDLQELTKFKLVDDDDDDSDDAPSVDIAKSEKQLPDNNTGIKWDPMNFSGADFACFAVDQHNLKE